MNQLRVVKSLNGGIEVLHRQHFSLYNEVGSVLGLAGPRASLVELAKYFVRLGWTAIGNDKRTFKKAELKAHLFDADRPATNGVAVDGSNGANIILALSSFSTSLKFYAQLALATNGKPTVVLAPIASPSAGTGDQDYRIENEANIAGKVVVGLLVTDEPGWLDYFGNLRTRVGPDHWGPGLAEYNKKLATRGEAIEIVIVDSKKGYLTFMPISAKANPQLRIFMSIFHGSGVKDHEKIKIGTDSGWSVDDSDIEMGFLSFNRKYISKEASQNDYSTYCAPASGEFRRPMPLAAFKHLVE
jgi:hypothetical protein